MAEELDLNEVVAAFLKKNLDSFLGTAKSVLHGAADKLRLKLQRTYSTYLKSLSQKHSKVKSFVISTEPVPLYKFYVPLDLKEKEKTLDSPSVVDILNVSSNVAIIGSAGCGKSMLVRHLLLDCLVKKLRVPVFIELRQFNGFEGNLYDLIEKTLATYGFTLERDYVAKAIDDGHFLLFLDGYDEVGHMKRKEVRAYIQDFVKEKDKNAVILTSRPDPELDGWQTFSILQVAPLTLPQARSLVKKLPFDSSIKSKFLKDLQEDLFKKHESFLSNPLLLSIMLLSYGQSATIPNKINIFYHQAYEALFERHDVLKEGFKREFLTSLDIQDFARIFSAFCMYAYDARKLEFNHTEALEYLEVSQRTVAIDVKKEDYLNDLIQAVCLLVQDGLQIVYAHRSFQEYFAARFICEAKPTVQKRLIEKYARSVRHDSVFDMIHEMRPEVIESLFVIPGLNSLFQSIKFKGEISYNNFKGFVELLASRFSFYEDGTLGLVAADDRMFNFVVFTLSRFGTQFGWSGFQRISEQQRKFVKRCRAKFGTSLVFAESPHTDEFLKELASKGAPVWDGLFSYKTIRILKTIKSKLEQRASLQEKTLASILNSE